MNQQYADRWKQHAGVLMMTAMLLAVSAVRADGQTKKFEDVQKEAASALKEMASALKEGKFERFLTHYYPAPELRQLREREQFHRSLRGLSSPAAKPVVTKIASILEKAADAHMTIDASGGLATFKVIVKGAPAVLSPDEPAADPVATNQGWGSDRNTAIEKAIAALDAGRHEEFVLNFFPISDLKAMSGKASVTAVAETLKTHTRLATAIIADLKTAIDEEPKLDGSVATWTLDADKAVITRFSFGRERSREFELKARVFQLQLVDGNWRLFDNSAAIDKQIGEGMKKAGADSVIEVKLELLGDSWRLYEMPQS